MRGKCDRCGKTLPYGDMCTVTEKRVAANVGDSYLLCFECLKTVDAAIRMAVDVAKGNRRGEEGDAE